MEKAEIQKLILSEIITTESNGEFIEVTGNIITIYIRVLKPHSVRVIFAQLDAIATYYNMTYNPKSIIIENVDFKNRDYNKITCEFKEKINN